MTDWPAPVDPAALHGPAGEFVLLTEPHTESDPMALLAQFLVCFGTAIGRTAHYAVEASRHYGRTQVSDLFSRNKKAREIDRALTALVEAGRLERGELRTAGPGRPAVVWRPVYAAQVA